MFSPLSTLTGAEVLVSTPVSTASGTENPAIFASKDFIPSFSIFVMFSGNSAARSAVFTFPFMYVGLIRDGSVPCFPERKSPTVCTGAA